MLNSHKIFTFLVDEVLLFNVETLELCLHNILFLKYSTQGKNTENYKF